MPFLDETGRLTDEGVLESYRHGSEAHAAVEILLKGPEERLPDGVHFSDKADALFLREPRVPFVDDAPP